MDWNEVSMFADAVGKMATAGVAVITLGGVIVRLGRNGSGAIGRWWKRRRANRQRQRRRPTQRQE